MQAVTVSWWSISTSALSAQAFKELASVCSGAELARSKKFVFAHDARAYLAAHGLLRHALSDAQPCVEPDEWTFTASPNGRPELGVERASNLRFNLSHCATRVNCIICPELDCGIDVEPAGRRQSLGKNDLHFLGPSERAWLATQTEQAQHESLMRFWTLKEALAKAVGLGLTLPFGELEFELEPTAVLTSAPAAGLGPWCLHQAVTADGHVESLAVRTADPINLVRREWAAAARPQNVVPYPLTVAQMMPIQPWSVW